MFAEALGDAARRDGIGIRAVLSVAPVMVGPWRWTSMRATSMQALPGRFSLHDSALRSVTIDPMGRVLLEITFDREWNEPIQEGLDTLSIRHDRVYRMT